MPDSLWTPFARSASMVHSPPIMSMLTALILAASVFPPAAAAPRLIPAEAANIRDEIRKPGASAVLVNVWASWCSPCREEFPDLLHVSRELAPKGLRTILVSVDFPGAEGDTQRFLTDQGVDFPTYVRTGKDEAFVNDLEAQWTGVIPATFLYDGNGKLVRFWEGKASYPVIKRRALEALGSKDKEKP